MKQLPRRWYYIQGEVYRTPEINGQPVAVRGERTPSMPLKDMAGGAQCDVEMKLCAMAPELANALRALVRAYNGPVTEAFAQAAKLVTVLDELT